MKVEMRHTEETIRRLAKVQYDTYCLGQKLMCFLTAVVLIVLGSVNRFDQGTSLVLLAIGCWIFTSLNAPADRNAKKIIEFAKGNLPASMYEFGGDAVLISGDEQQTELRYSDIYSLICDGTYLYLFISKLSAYMVPLHSLEKQEAEKLKAMLTEKTSLSIEKPGSLLNISIRSLKRSFGKPGR